MSKIAKCAVCGCGLPGVHHADSDYVACANRDCNYYEIGLPRPRWNTMMALLRAARVDDIDPFYADGVRKAARAFFKACGRKP